MLWVAKFERLGGSWLPHSMSIHQNGFFISGCKSNSGRNQKQSKHIHSYPSQTLPNMAKHHSFPVIYLRPTHGQLQSPKSRQPSEWGIQISTLLLSHNIKPSRSTRRLWRLHVAPCDHPQKNLRSNNCYLPNVPWDDSHQLTLKFW